MQPKAVYEKKKKEKSVTLASVVSGGLSGQGPPAGRGALLHSFTPLYFLSPALSILSLGGNMNAADSKIRHFKGSW